MRFAYLLAVLTLSMTTATTNASAPGTPCTAVLSAQADGLLSSTTPSLLASQLFTTTLQSQLLASLTPLLRTLPHCKTSQSLHASLDNPPATIFFPTDSPTAIPSIFPARLSPACRVHPHDGLYSVSGIDAAGPGAAFLSFRGARMVAFDVAEDAVVKVVVRVSCDGEWVGSVPFGEFTVGGLREALGRGFMVGRVGEA